MDQITEYMEIAAKDEAKQLATKQAEIEEQQNHCRKAIVEAAHEYLNLNIGPATIQFDYTSRGNVQEAWAEVHLDGFNPLYLVTTYHPALAVELTVLAQNLSPERLRNGRHYSNNYQTQIDNPLGLGHIFIKLKEAYDKEQAEKEASRQAQEKSEKVRTITELTVGLETDFESGYFINEREAAVEAIRQLKAIAPERIDEWSTLFDKWEKTKAEADRVLEAKTDYANRFDVYWKELQLARTTNAARLDGLQSRWDNPYEVYEVEYALVANEEGKRYIETRTVTCLAPRPPKDSCHQVLDRYGQITPLIYHNEVSVSEPRRIYPTDKDSCASHIDVGKETGDLNNAVYFSPLDSGPEVGQDIVDTFEPLPVKPEVPEILDHYDIKTIEGQIIHDDPDFKYHHYY